jgi:hypothetical protein
MEVVGLELRRGLEENRNGRWSVRVTPKMFQCRAAGTSVSVIYVLLVPSVPRSTEFLRSITITG